jgi:hypothetical protein
MNISRDSIRIDLSLDLKRKQLLRLTDQGKQHDYLEGDQRSHMAVV